MDKCCAEKVIIKRLEDAFASREMPLSLSSSRQLAPDESEALSALQHIADGSDYDFDYWQINHDVLFLLSPQAFAFFFPKFIAMQMREVEKHHDDALHMLVVWFVISELNRPIDLIRKGDWIFERFSLFTANELSAIESWLWWLEETILSQDDLCQVLQALECILYFADGVAVNT